MFANVLCTQCVPDPDLGLVDQQYQDQLPRHVSGPTSAETRTGLRSHCHGPSLVELAPVPGGLETASCTQLGSTRARIEPLSGGPLMPPSSGVSKDGSYGTLGHAAPDGPSLAATAAIPGLLTTHLPVALRPAECSAICVAARIYQQSQSRIAVATAAIGPSLLIARSSMPSPPRPVSHSRATSRSPYRPLVGSFFRR
jgi:hypothetical protein